MVNRNFLVLAFGIVALALALGEHVSAAATHAGAHQIDAITVDLDPAGGSTTLRIGRTVTDQANKGFTLVGSVPCQQQVIENNAPVLHDTVVLIFQR